MHLNKGSWLVILPWQTVREVQYACNEALVRDQIYFQMHIHVRSALWCVGMIDTKAASS